MEIVDIEAQATGYPVLNKRPDLSQPTTLPALMKIPIVEDVPNFGVVVSIEGHKVFVSNKYILDRQLAESLTYDELVAFLVGPEENGRPDNRERKE